MIKPWFLLSISCLSAQGSVMLVGGNAESYGGWSDEPYGWFVQQANSGKIINIDVSEASNWYPEYFIHLGADTSSHSLQIPNLISANSQNIFIDLTSAGGIFIEGGDQWEYVQTWKGTLVDSAIHMVFNNGGVIGGTSAGLAILGEIVFDASKGSLTSEQVIANPYHPRVSFTDDFLHILPGVLTDSHFNDRGRLGRLVTMVARRAKDNGENILGLGLGIKTAFCIEQNNIGKVYGKMMTIIHQTDESELVCESLKPLKFTHISFHHLLHGAEFDIAERRLIYQGEYMASYDMSHKSYYGSDVTIINGSNQHSENYGELVITGVTDNADNWWYGGLSTVNGDSTFIDGIIIPKIWNDYDYLPNRLIGGLYGIAADPPKFALYLDDNCSVTINMPEPGMFTVSNYAHILDPFPTGYAGLLDGILPGVSGAKLHFFTNGDIFDYGQYYLGATIESDGTIPSSFTLNELFPNPFNPNVTLRGTLEKGGILIVNIYNIKGSLIQSIEKSFLHSGTYSVTWVSTLIPSGVYFFQVQFGEEIKVIKGALVK